jgi:hypothetical protein
LCAPVIFSNLNPATHMKRVSAISLFTLALTFVAVSCTNDPAATTPLTPSGKPSAAKDANNGHISIAVIGDFPYGPAKRADMPHLVDEINADPTIERTIHLGDIKAGSNSDCSNAYFDDIRHQFDRFVSPLVYTPGDNEWTDCHQASKNNGLYTPTERLIRVRQVFFPVVGQTLGINFTDVISQAQVDPDPSHRQYVENVMWTKGDVVFATLNITGSNDDLVSWGLPLPADAANYPSQAQERATRTKANHDWIERAFDRAKNAKAVVLGLQADMWDATSPLSAFDPIVVQIGTLAQQFGKPVLLLEGDSHVFRIDQPFTPASPLFALHPNTPVASNVTRLVVNGSSSRTEYVRLTINPEAKDGKVFTWVEVPLQQ